MFYHWQTVDKKITKSKIEVALKGAIEMLKEKVAIFKEHIHIKPNDLIIQVDFAKSYKNE